MSRAVGARRFTVQRGAFTCPCCGAVMRNPDDVANLYCGRCHWYTGDPEMGPAHLAAECSARIPLSWGFWLRGIRAGA